MKKLIITLILIVLFTGCGGGGGGGGESAPQTSTRGTEIVTPTGTPFRLKMSLDPSGTPITSFEASIQFPPGVAVATDASGNVAPGVVLFSENIPSNTLKVVNYQPHASLLTVAIPTNSVPFQSGEITILCADGTGDLPMAGDFSFKSLSALSGISSIGITPVFSVEAL